METDGGNQNPKCNENYQEDVELEKKKHLWAGEESSLPRGVS